MAEASEQDAEVQALILSLREGDSREALAFYEKYRLVIYRHVGFANSSRVTEQDAEEITQETFIRAFRSVKDFQGRSSIKTWLITLARHAAADYLRSPKHRYGGASVISEASVTYSGDSPEEQLDAARKREQLRRALFRLSREHRAVITYRVFDKLSVKETAHLMERSEAAVKQLTLRATRALQLVLLEDATATERQPHTKQGRRT